MLLLVGVDIVHSSRAPERSDHAAMAFIAAARRLTGSDPRGLVESVPEDYPKNARTVRRDLEALEAVGFPLVTDHHNGQTRWRLMEGFRDIPALGFSATELMALVLSRNLLKPLDGTEIQRRSTPR